MNAPASIEILMAMLMDTEDALAKATENAARLQADLNAEVERRVNAEARATAIDNVAAEIKAIRPTDISTIEQLLRTMIDRPDPPEPVVGEMVFDLVKDAAGEIRSIVLKEALQ